MATPPLFSNRGRGQPFRSRGGPTWRGRGRGEKPPFPWADRPPKTSAYARPPTSTEYITKDLDAYLERFDPISDADVKETSADITNLKTIASYSWIPGDIPKILVPASPPIWLPRATITKVPPDSGTVFSDQNSARMGDKGSPLLPLFGSILSMNLPNPPTFTDIDFVTDRNNLRKLFRWASPPPTPSPNDPGSEFRIDIERVGKTVFLTRIDAEDTVEIVGFRGFNTEYEKAATKLAKGTEGATGHHRVISFDFGGLNALLRFEVDACTGDEADTDALRDPDEVAADEDDDGLSGLTSKLTGLGTTSTSSTKLVPSESPPFSPNLAIVHAPGIPPADIPLVPQHSIIKLKTRAAHKALEWHEIYPQLFFSQTPWLYLARHTRGLFEPIQKIPVTGPDMMDADIAPLVERGLKKVRMVLNRVILAVRMEKEGVGLALVCQKGELVLYQRKEGTGKALGEEIRKVFDE
ncbi:hypothetical protein FRB99_005079 [Tulasnella sp. 403]|nr:hypothetical protein FRB99_005079 [Tulasnella sp. 403]